MKGVRILIADDHEVVRRGVRTLLETRPEWEVCGEAAGGREAVQKAKQLKPDVVVLDIGMPDLNGLEATRQILRTVPRTEVIILTIHDSEQVIHDVLDAGARGYVLKSDAGRDLVTAVETLRQHKPFLTHRVSERLLQDYLGKGAVNDRQAAARRLLTPREREIVQLLAEGKTNKEVASSLSISPKTAETHRSNIMHKLGLHSVSELVRYAIRNRIILP